MSILAACDELGVASREARAFGEADPCPDPVWAEHFLGILATWSDTVGLMHAVHAEPDLIEDPEAQLEALHVVMQGHEKAISDRSQEIFGS